MAVLVVTADGGRTRRHLEGPNCETIAEAAVLIVAMIHAERVGAVLQPQLRIPRLSGIA